MQVYTHTSPPLPCSGCQTFSTPQFRPQNWLISEAVGEECAAGRTVSPEWRCLENSCLVQDQDAKSQVGGILPEAHDASLQEKSIVIPTAVRYTRSPSRTVLEHPGTTARTFSATQSCHPCVGLLLTLNSASRER